METHDADNLIHRYFDGELDDAGCEQLWAWVGESRANLEHFVRVNHLNRCLRDEVCAQKNRKIYVDQPLTQWVKTRQILGHIEPAVSRPAAPARHPRPVWQPLALAAAVALLIGGLIVAAIFQNEPAQAPQVATLVDVFGSVRVQGTSDETARAVSAGQPLRVGEHLTVGDDRSFAQIQYPDGTLVDLVGTSNVVVEQRAGAKRLHVERGFLTADVAKQTHGPFVFHTARADAEVLGTRLHLDVAGEATQLEVDHGRVRLRRNAGFNAGESVEVIDGQYAVAAEGVPLSPIRNVHAATINFGIPREPVAEGTRQDRGAAFDTDWGFGWTDTPGRVLGGWNPDGGSSLSGSYVRFADAASNPHTWQMRLSNGWYRVTVSVGATEEPGGPHRVLIEGERVFDGLLTRDNESVTRTVLVRVRDGNLTLRAGGGDRREGLADRTTLNFISIQKVDESPLSHRRAQAESSGNNG